MRVEAETPAAGSRALRLRDRHSPMRGAAANAAGQATGASEQWHVVGHHGSEVAEYGRGCAFVG